MTKEAESFPPEIKSQDGTRGRPANLWTKCDSITQENTKVPCDPKNARLLLGEGGQQKRAFKETELTVCTNDRTPSLLSKQAGMRQRHMDGYKTHFGGMVPWDWSKG